MQMCSFKNNRLAHSTPSSQPSSQPLLSLWPLPLLESTHQQTFQLLPKSGTFRPQLPFQLLLLLRLRTPAGTSGEALSNPVEIATVQPI